MLTHPQFDPIAISIGSFGIRWYGLMYLVGFVAALLLGRARAQHDPWRGWMARDMDDVVRQAAAFAESDDTVLLAPACASFDQFENYAARGDAFCSAVEGLRP